MICRQIHHHICTLSQTPSNLAKPSRTHFLRVFLTVLLALLLFSFVIRSSSYLSVYDPQAHHGPFSHEGRSGRKSKATAAIMQAQLEAVSDQRLIRDEALYCDRSHFRTDVCVGRGDVRVLGGGQKAQRVYEVMVYAGGGQERMEKVKPYTRKWEESVMKTIDEVQIFRKVRGDSGHADTENVNYSICEVQHEVPAILFSTGGYTGNVYHEFNDGLIPLFITAQKYKPAGQLVLLLLEYHNWWISKYAEILGQLTNYTIIDLATDKRMHCFSEITVGLHIHDELSIDSDRLRQRSRNKSREASMAGFQSMLYAAYRPRLPAMPNISKDVHKKATIAKKPVLVIISRNGSRVLLNERNVVALAEEIGFSVQVLCPTPTTEMVELYATLSRCDVMMGVHGAAMTHLVFMRPGATFIQVVPLGTDWAADTYYGEPARKLGLRYVAYKVKPEESSLWGRYASDDPVLVNPDSVNRKGWWETKRIYLEGQNVTVSLARLDGILRSAYARGAVAMATSSSQHQ